MTMREAIVHQFRKPTGVLGHLAGRIMANRPSNITRNHWFADLMAVAPHHVVLEIGSGPGVGLSKLARRASSGHVVGLDHSPEMLRQAASRLAAEGLTRRTSLVLGRAEDASDLLRGPFDRIGAVNVAQFWPDPALVLDGLQALLAPTGRIVVVHQPRLSASPRSELDGFANRVLLAAEEVGLAERGRLMLDTDPVPVLGLILCKTRRI